MGLMDAGGRPGRPRYCCGGALVHCRAALTKAAKGRLWGALGVWWGGIGLFLDGYVLADWRKNPRLLQSQDRVGSLGRNKNKRRNCYKRCAVTTHSRDSASR